MTTTSSSGSDRVVTVERVIPAPPERIFAILADPRRHPEVDGSGTVRQAAPAGPSRLSQGAKFGMAMKFGMPYRMVNTVVEFEDEIIEKRQRARAEELGFKLTEHSLIMYGECLRQNCPNLRTTPRKS